MGQYTDQKYYDKNEYEAEIDHSDEKEESHDGWPAAFREVIVMDSEEYEVEGKVY